MACMAEWKGLDAVLAEISETSPGARLEHTLGGEEWAEEAGWRGQPEKRILPVERWLAIVRKDIRNALDPHARTIITGPYYFWGFDEFGRAVVSANDAGRVAPMFVEVWAGEPD